MHTTDLFVRKRGDPLAEARDLPIDGKSMFNNGRDRGQTLWDGILVLKGTAIAHTYSVPYHGQKNSCESSCLRVCVRETYAVIHTHTSTQLIRNGGK